MTLVLSKTKILPHWLQCPDCKGYFDPHNDPYATVSDGFDEKTICGNCLNRMGEYLCDDCNEFLDPDGDVDGCLCEDCAEAAGWAKCEGCAEWIKPDDISTSPNGDSYCDACFGDYFSFCAGCSKVFDTEDMTVYDYELYCRGCVGDVRCGEDFEPAGFKRRTGRTTKIGSERCYGVELETDHCADYADLEDSGAWGAKDDPTVSGKELYSTILDGDEGLEAIIELADLAEMNDWRVANDCGYHLHLDMRKESEDSLFAAAYAYRATQELWISFVDSTRSGNQYSHRARWELADLEGFDGSFIRFILDETTDRYEWVNLRAYTSHTTFEIRLHHGSIDGKEICNWIMAHTRFMDWATTTGFAGVKEALDSVRIGGIFDFVADEVWKDDELRDYYAKKCGRATCAA